MRYRMKSAFLALLLGVVSSFAVWVNLNLTRMNTCGTETRHKCASTKLGDIREGGLVGSSEDRVCEKLLTSNNYAWHPPTPLRQSNI